MKLIKPSFEIWEQEHPWEIHHGEDDTKVISLASPAFDEVSSKEALLRVVYKQIEKAGRTCYKSEDKITDDSAYPFVKRLIDSDHLAMLEHGTVYLTFWWNGNVCEHCDQSIVPDYIQKYLDNKYCRCVWQNNFLHVTTNLRVIVENGWEEDCNRMCPPTEYHEKRVTVHFICNRQVSHEFVRHRVFSFAQESTRYCNYTKGKFGGELTFIQPCWCNSNLCEIDKWREHKFSSSDLYTLELFSNIESTYFKLIKEGWKPQEAATILPNAIKTELVMTGFVSDWEHFFDLRALGTTGAPHPQAKELAYPLMEEFIKKGYILEKK